MPACPKHCYCSVLTCYITGSSSVLEQILASPQGRSEAQGHLALLVLWQIECVVANSMLTITCYGRSHRSSLGKVDGILGMMVGNTAGRLSYAHQSSGFGTS